MAPSQSFSWEKLYKKTYQNLRIGLFRTDSQGKLIDADEGLVHLMGFTDLKKFIQSCADRAWLGQVEQDAISSLPDNHQNGNQWQTSLQRNGGQPIWADIHAYAVRSSLGAVIGFEGTVQEIVRPGADVTKRRQKPRVDASTDDTYDQLILQLTRVHPIDLALVAETSADDPSIIFVHAVYSHGKLLKQPGHYPITGTPYERVLQVGAFTCPEQADKNYPGLRLLHSQIFEGFAGVPLTDSNQQIVGILAVLTASRMEDPAPIEKSLADFASLAEKEYERLKNISRLEASERRYRALVENAPDGLAIIDTDGEILYESPASSRIFAASPMIDHARKFTDYVHPDDLPRMNDSFENVLQNPGNSVPFLFRRIHKEGPLRWIEGNATNLLQDDAIQGILVSFHDVTEQRKASRLLRAGEKELLYRAKF